MIVGQEDGGIFAFDRVSGAVRCVASSVLSPPARDGMGSFNNDHRLLALAGSTLIAISTAGTVQALDAATGRELWRAVGSPGGIINRPAIDALAVYVTHLGPLVAYELATGRVRYALPADFVGTPIPDGDRLYVAGYDGFYALRKD